MRTEELSIAYAGKPAVDSVTLPVRQGEVLALIGPSGCGKTTLLRSLNRLVELTPTASRGGADHARRRRHRPDRGHGPQAAGEHGLPAAQPVPDEHLRQRRLRAARAGLAAPGARRPRAGGDRRARARRALRRGQRRPRPPRAAPVGRTAAAPVHRALAGRAAGGAAARRAVLRARPALDRGDRGADPDPADRHRGRDRDPQPPAGAEGRRPRRVHVSRRARRVRAGRAGLRRSARAAHGATT